MTLTVDLKTWFKVIARPLPKGTLCVKYESDWAKGREYIYIQYASSWQVISDARIRGPNY